MNKKVSLLIVSIILAIAAFIGSTYIQKKAVNYVPTIKCLMAKKDIEEYEKAEEQDFYLVDMPIEIIANSKIAKSFDEIKNLYFKNKIYKGQIVLQNQLDTAANLMIFNGEEGKEKISLKIKNPENGVSYILKPGSLVNVYATLNNDYALNGVFKDVEKQTIGDEFSGYSVLNVLSSVKILSTFNENGEEVEDLNERNIDTILIAVTKEEAFLINLIRDVATFNVTEI